MFEFFWIFAFVTAITPGPNNSLLMASGIKFGRKKSIPHFLGIWLGFTFLFFVGGFLLHIFQLKFLIIFNMLVTRLLHILHTGLPLLLDTNVKGSTVEKPFTFIQACLFQWINPKGVVMAVSGLTAFNITNNQGALIYFLVLPFCVGIWLILGEQLQNSLKKNKTVARAAYVVLA